MTTSQNGGFSKPTGIAITFDSTHPLVRPADRRLRRRRPRRDDRARTSTSRTRSTTPSLNATLTGTVVHAVSVDMDPTTTGDEYATIQAASGHVLRHGLPTGDLPEGLRGEHLKITGGEPEAEGQVALVLGSYLTHITLTSASGTTFTLSFAGGAPITLNVSDTAGQLEERDRRPRRRRAERQGHADGDRLRHRAARDALPDERRPVHDERRLLGRGHDRRRHAEARERLVGRAAADRRSSRSASSATCTCPTSRSRSTRRGRRPIVVFEDGRQHLGHRRPARRRRASNDAMIHVRLSADPGNGNTVHVSLGDNDAGPDRSTARRPAARRSPRSRSPAVRPARGRPSRTSGSTRPTTASSAASIAATCSRPRPTATRRTSRRSRSATTTTPASPSPSPTARRT